MPLSNDKRTNFLVVDGNRWSLTGYKGFWSGSTKQLIIRDIWNTYRDLIIGSSYPHCVKLSGKSGRGKSVFLRYLIFYILLEAKKRYNDGSTVEEHLTDPRIAFMDRNRILYHITKEKITIFPNLTDLVTEVGYPHFYFSDNVDFDDVGAGSLVTMAVTGGDADVLKEFVATQ